MISDNKLKFLLMDLNKENYANLKLGLNQRVSDVERVLFRIEFKLFGNDKIQQAVYKECLDKNLKTQGKK